jgi:glycogen phosphorylase
MLNNNKYPVQIIWAGKPYPFDYGAIETFNHLIRLTKDYPNATVLVGYELELSRFLKNGSDIWLNNPVVTREASGTSGMTAAMNASVNLSTYDGWVCEFAKDGENSFIIPEADRSLSPEDRDRHDLLGFYQVLNEKVLPTTTTSRRVEPHRSQLDERRRPLLRRRPHGRRVLQEDLRRQIARAFVEQAIP